MSEASQQVKTLMIARVADVLDVPIDHARTLELAQAAVEATGAMALYEALKEAQAWIPRGDKSTPEQNGAVCSFRSDALEMVATALKKVEEV